MVVVVSIKSESDAIDECTYNRSVLFLKFLQLFSGISRIIRFILHFFLNIQTGSLVRFLLIWQAAVNYGSLLDYGMIIFE